MARKTKEEAEKTRKKILQAALDVFHDKGYAGSTLVDIAKTINLTKGAIYWHFKSKIDLFKSLAEDMEAQMDGELADLHGGVSDLASLRNLSLKSVHLIATNPRLRKYYSLIYYRLEWSEELNTVIDYFFTKDEEMKKFVTSIVQSEHDAGSISSSLPVDAIALSWMAINDGFLSRVLMGMEDTETLFKDFEIALDIFIRGARK